MNAVIALFLLWIGGSLSTAIMISVVGKLGGRFKFWEMVAGALVWPAAPFLAWRDHGQMMKEPQIIDDIPGTVFVCPETLCPACRASFDAVMTRITECRTCTPLPRDEDLSH